MREKRTGRGKSQKSGEESGGRGAKRRLRPAGAVWLILLLLLGMCGGRALADTPHKIGAGPRQDAAKHAAGEDKPEDTPGESVPGSSARAESGESVSGSSAQAESEESVSGSSAQAESGESVPGSSAQAESGEGVSGSSARAETEGSGAESGTSEAAWKKLEDIRRRIRETTQGYYGMLPIYGCDIEDGIYPVEVSSNSPFFKIRSAKLQVQDGDMTLVFELGSASYLMIFPGTAQEAEKAGETEWIDVEQLGDSSRFSMRILALNQLFDCAAFSKNRRQWYDRKLLVDAASLPEGALRVELPDYALIEQALLTFPEDQLPEEVRDRLSEEAEDKSEGHSSDAPADTGAGGGEDLSGSEDTAPDAVRVALDDGEYSIEVTLAGGSGRASVSSPTLLKVRDGKAYARLIWSSAYYDYMLLDGVRYDNLTADGGNSVFEIPITGMDEGISVIADTTAMGDPVEIAYVLTFYSERIGEKGLIPQEAAKKVLVIALAIILLGGIANHFIQKSRR